VEEVHYECAGCGEEDVAVVLLVEVGEREEDGVLYCNCNWMGREGGEELTHSWDQW
jgi:hypothetical protein